MNYTLHQLQVFLEVVKQQSITKAAEQMFMTQPALSIQLKNFQQQFDQPLTEVVGRKLYITDFGREIAELAEGIQQQSEMLKYKTKAYAGGLSGRLKISVVSTGKYVLPYYLTDFLKEHTGIDLSLDVTNKMMDVDALKKNEVDFALVSVLPEKMDLEHIDLLENKLYMMSNVKDVQEDYPLIYREKGSATRQGMDDFVGRQKDRKPLELTSNEAVKQAVIAGLGRSIIPLIGTKHELESGELHILPMPGLPITTTWQLVWLKGKRFAPAAQAYLNFIECNKEEISRKYFGWYLKFEG
ncbi:LysR family transcriptional regulator [Persicobacter psychrovividus]|uniref:LysR family transcriptional regulator n=1 Tax=Persicobacter psychrovividus TaxID=387638 RepID=A0ABN6L4V6_9BACT|nr:LysR family transcriptional regulator [Persicobacter psychrovividus]